MTGAHKPARCRPSTTVELFLPLGRRLVLKMRGSGLDQFKTLSVHRAASHA